MAKADGDPSTFALIPYLTGELARQRQIGRSRSEAMRVLDRQLRSGEIGAIALPPGWRLDLGPQDEAFIVTAEGDILHGLHGFIPDSNLLKVVPLTPGQQAAIDAMPCPPPPPPLDETKQAPITAPGLINSQVWLDRVLKTEPRSQGESKAAYARRLHGMMPKAVSREWTWKTVLRHLFKLG